MTTIKEIKQKIKQDTENWLIPFMDFVDEFRRHKDPSLVREPFENGDERFDAILASMVECLCDELELEIPDWVWNVPSCGEPWFVSEMENLKAISIVESPVWFRRRKIFVLENFLDRV
ncbi:hypothetical protein QUF72_01030 [Desulfobacterales bacterium HSG2]|nr:hypothetical protein [Desulfobacterales bacterium HSG2]